MAKVKFSRGSQNSYKNLQVKDGDTIYVCTDTGNIYLGDDLLFEPNAYINSSISGKTVTFRTHGANGTNGSDTLDLSVFQTAAEVQSAINAAVSSVYRPSGNINLNASGEIDSYLVEDAVGWVFNLESDYTVTAQTVGYFIDAQVGQKIKAGTNLVIVAHSQGGTTTYKWDLLGGFMDLSNYVEKVSNPTAGNFAGLDANGNITDSGSKASDFKTKQTAVTPAAGNSNGAAGGQYVEQVTQNANGEVTVTRKKLPDFTGSGSVGAASSATDAWKTVVHDASLSSARVLSGNTKTIPAATASADGYMTKEQAKKLVDIEEGSEVNLIEAVKVSGTALTITNKAVNIVTESTYNASTNKIATMADAGVDWGSF